MPRWSTQLAIAPHATFSSNIALAGCVQLMIEKGGDGYCDTRRMMNVDKERYCNTATPVCHHVWPSHVVESNSASPWGINHAHAIARRALFLRIAVSMLG